MTELRNLAREQDLRGNSKLRKAESIAFLQNDENRVVQQCQQQQRQQQPTTDENVDILLTKRQCKHRHTKNRKQAKRFTS